MTAVAQASSVHNHTPLTPQQTATPSPHSTVLWYFRGTPRTSIVSVACMLCGG